MNFVFYRNILNNVFKNYLYTINSRDSIPNFTLFKTKSMQI